MVKWLQNNKKYGIFQNWLDTHPKMETHDPNVYPTILGGVSRGFWSPFLDLGARSALLPKVPIFKCQNDTSDDETKKPRLLSDVNIPPKWWIACLFLCDYHFWVGFYCYTDKKLKVSKKLEVLEII